MVSSTRGSTRNSCACCAVIVLACASQIAITAIAIALATNHMSLNGSMHRIAWAASASDIVAVASSLAAALLYVYPGNRSTRLGLCIPFIIVAILAAVLTMYTLAYTWTDTKHATNQDRNYKAARSLTQAGFAVWSVTIVAQTMLYTIVVWRRPDQAVRQPAEELTPRPSPVRSVKRSISVHLGSLSPPPPLHFLGSKSEPASPTFSAQSFSPKSSLRHSIHQVVRPMTSKTKLLLRHPSLSRDSFSFGFGRETSMDAIRQDVDFGDWDTTDVEEMNEQNFVRKASRRRLETIPGSRPVSPAKPLDGPFLEDRRESAHLPESPMHSPMASISSESSSFRFSPPPTLRENSIDQSHIHPLFRSESPVPPPLASPGTVITASPYAGQVVSPEHQAFVPRKLHSSQSFRVESPSPLSPPRSRQGSFRSLQMHQAPP